MRKLTLSFASCFAISACVANSSNLQTNQMTPSFTVGASGDSMGSTTVKAVLNNGITTTVALSTGDSLTVAEAGGTPKALNKQQDVLAVSYATTFTSADAGGTEYDFALTRNAPAISAPKSSCVLPPQFTITGPTGASGISRSTQDINVTYTPAGSDKITYQILGQGCLNDVGTQSESGDSGSFSIPRSQLVLSNTNATTCSGVVLIVTRSRTGTTDQDFASGGTVTCSQSRQVTFTSIP